MDQMSNNLRGAVREWLKILFGIVSALLCAAALIYAPVPAVLGWVPVAYVPLAALAAFGVVLYLLERLHIVAYLHEGLHALAAGRLAERDAKIIQRALAVEVSKIRKGRYLFFLAVPLLIPMALALIAWGVFQLPLYALAVFSVSLYWSSADFADFLLVAPRKCQYVYDMGNELRCF